MQNRPLSFIKQLIDCDREKPRSSLLIISHRLNLTIGFWSYVVESWSNRARTQNYSGFEEIISRCFNGEDRRRNGTDKNSCEENAYRDFPQCTMEIHQLY